MNDPSFTPAPVGPSGRMMIDGRSFQVINAPITNPSSFSITALPNEMLVVLSRLRPSIPISPQGMPPENETAIVQEPTNIIQMSYQSAKDFLLLLQGAIADREREYGPIETDFTRRLSKD